MLNVDTRDVEEKKEKKATRHVKQRERKRSGVEPKVTSGDSQQTRLTVPLSCLLGWRGCWAAAERVEASESRKFESCCSCPCPLLGLWTLCSLLSGRQGEIHDYSISVSRWAKAVFQRIYSSIPFNAY